MYLLQRNGEAIFNASMPDRKPFSQVHFAYHLRREEDMMCFLQGQSGEDMHSAALTLVGLAQERSCHVSSIVCYPHLARPRTGTIYSVRRYRGSPQADCWWQRRD